MNKPSFGRRDFLKIMGSALGLGALSYYFGLRSQPPQAAPGQIYEYLDAGLAFPAFRGPYLQKDARLAAFLLPASVEALSTLCAETLNAVPDSPFEYIPILSNVLVVYAEMLVSSLDERDARVGSIPETEVGFWILTAAMQKTAAGKVPHHLAWHVPFLLVDEGNAIATGREVYGFNKQAAAFAKTENVAAPTFSVDVLGFERFAPDAVARKERLLDVAFSGRPSSSPGWADWHTAQAEMRNALLPHLRSDLDEGFVAFAARAALQNIPLVFLKQFRDAAQPQTACFQRIVEAPLQIEAFYGGGMLSQPCQATLRELDSHPLARQLGLKKSQASALEAWLHVDFTLGLGTPAGSM